MNAVRHRARAVIARLPRRRPPLHPVARVIAEFGRAYPDAVFVQVGSNDGQKLDPLHAEITRRAWRGVLVEPVPYIFDRLRATHAGNPRLALENVAVADADGSRPFHYLPERSDGADVPEWYDALGSFRRDVIAKHRDQIPDIEQHIETMDVPCLTFSSLCARHGLTKLDLVHIDTEGYDYEVVRRIDLDALEPKVVLYEHFHLDAATKQACADHLAAHGYEALTNGMDALCLRPDLVDRRHRRLLRVWRRLRAQEGGG